MSDPVRQIESALADMLDAYASLREKYIHPTEPDAVAAVRESDIWLQAEVAAYRGAARLIRDHRDEDAGMGVPSWLHGEWAEAEQQTCVRLDAALRDRGELLGHLVVAERDGSVSAVGPVWSDRGRAVAHHARITRDSVEHPGMWRGAEFKLAAVREEKR